MLGTREVLVLGIHSRTRTITRLRDRVAWIKCNNGRLDTVRKRNMVLLISPDLAMRSVTDTIRRNVSTGFKTLSSQEPDMCV